jgi:hypothetical protein
MTREQTEVAQELFHKTQSLMKQTDFSQSTLRSWGDVLYYMTDKVTGIQEGKRSKEIGEQLVTQSVSEYKERYSSHKEHETIARDEGRKKAILERIRGKQAMPGLSSAQIDAVRNLGSALRGAGVAAADKVAVKTQSKSPKERTR